MVSTIRLLPVPDQLTFVIKNEYAKQLKELRAQDTSGKAHGKVFVKGAANPYVIDRIALTSID